MKPKRAIKKKQKLEVEDPSEKYSGEKLYYSLKSSAMILKPDPVRYGDKLIEFEVLVLDD